MSSPPCPPPYDLFQGSDPHRQVLRATDWSRSAVGHPDTWPPALRSSVGLMLDSRFPMFVAWGEELTFLYNDAYVYLLGEKHPAALGASLPRVWPELWPQVRPLIDTAFSGQATMGEDVTRMIRRNGRDEPSTFTLSYSPLRDETGAVAGAFCVIRDTTARTRLEQRQAFQLRLSDALRAHTEPAQILSVTAELLGKHLNASRVLSGDYDCDQHVMTFHSNYAVAPALELVGTFPAASFGSENFKSIENGTTWVCEDIANDPRTSTGNVFPAFYALGIRSAIAVPNHRAGAIINCLIINSSHPRAWRADEIEVVEDVAHRMWIAVERARAEAALVQADRRKDQFLAMLAHELRNPLAPISSAAELLKLGTLDHDRVRSTGALIARQVGHMTGLVDDLLDVSRVTSGMAIIQQEDVDIKRVLAAAMEQVRPLMEARKHRCVVQTAPGHVAVCGDYTRLVQIAANLLHNAVKYTPEHGRIEVALEASDEHVTLKVADNGVGISAELLPHVFELFSQAERSSDRAHGGLGLGLALVKSLVELHGGAVTAASAGVNAGSSFAVRLPRLAPREAPEVAAWPERGSAAAGMSLRLMVVDDNVDGAQMLAMFLEASGHLVAVEHSGQAALARAATASFDAFLLDIGLPGMDGKELAQRLRQLPQARDAMLVAITGYGLPADGAESLKAGFDHYMVKPVDPLAVAELLAEIVRA
ncbi:hybrid sensor histidine kinase/response regulator [Massilia soli]|uniref:histidine kinase n=1 Tax=Massilia soli TaxID=2792854 RepID=A0ABS7SSU3_9BURK|nr:ATP-binding protein [Massilia soli]MBZ2209000.1 response regulator [Massilia soli]